MSSVNTVNTHLLENVLTILVMPLKLDEFVNFFYIYIFFIVARSLFQPQATLIIVMIRVVKICNNKSS